MADSSAQDKNLPASQRKLDKAREEGQVARSRDLGHFSAMAAGGIALFALAPRAAEWMKDALVRALSFRRADVVSSDAMGRHLAELTGTLLAIVVPFGLVMVLVALAASIGMGGWTWTGKPMGPNFGAINPLTGIGRVFSKKQLIDAFKASLLALVLGSTGAIYLGQHVDTFVGLLGLPLPSAVAGVLSSILGGLAFLVGALALFAAVDVPLQKHLHAQKLKMSHQEVKQEHKELEGNAEVKSKVRTLMRERTKRRMMAAVPLADLVVMNPTHYAVALKYDDKTMGAPRVVAKGADLLAMRIRDVAEGARVPVLQAPVLARALYAHAEIDREIPAALFAAVAQVLAYVYQLRAAMAGQVAMPGELPPLDVPPGLDPNSLRTPPSAIPT